MMKDEISVKSNNFNSYLAVNIINRTFVSQN